MPSRLGGAASTLPDKPFNAAKTAPKSTPLELYDVRHDVHEDHEVSAQHPDVVKRLTALAEKIRAEIGDVEKPGSGQRKAGWVEVAKPLLPE